MSHSKQHPDHLSKQLEALVESMDATVESSISVGELERRLKHQNVAILLILFSLPFVQPIPLPGLSVVLGILIAVFGLKVSLGDRGSLPNFIAKRELPEARLKSVIKKMLPVIIKVERLLKPRLKNFFSRRYYWLIGFFIVTSGLALMLPLPPVILFSNSIPAWAVICIALGLLEKDGLMLWVGHVLAISTWVYFYFWWEVVRLAFEKILMWF